MPFGLTNAPTVFQAMVNDVLRNFINHFVFVYMDDILIFPKNQANHVRRVRLVLQRLLENRLFVKGEKCKFHVQTVSFLGFTVEQRHLRGDSAKVRAVVELPEPKKTEGTTEVLGIYKLLPSICQRLQQSGNPLTPLTSPKVSFSLVFLCSTVLRPTQAAFLT